MLRRCVSYNVPTALSYANHLTVHDETLAKRLTGDLPGGVGGKVTAVIQTTFTCTELLSLLQAFL